MDLPNHTKIQYLTKKRQKIELKRTAVPVVSFSARVILALRSYCDGCAVVVMATNKALDQSKVNDWAGSEGWDNLA